MDSPSVLQLESRRDKGIEWLLKSGIRDSEGGYKSLFTPEKKEYHCWGEGTTCLLCTSGAVLVLLRERDFLEEAIQSGEHICKLLITNKGSFNGALLAGKGSYAIHPYYSSFAIKALKELHTATKVGKYLEIADVAGRWLIANMQNGNGSFDHVKYIRYKNFKRRFFNRFHLWDGIIAPILMELHQITNNLPYKISAKKLTNWLMKNQKKDGSFDCYRLPIITRIVQSSYRLNFKELANGCTKTHPMSLIGPFEAFLDNGLEEKALKIYSWMKNKLSKNGLFYQYYYGNGQHSIEEDTMPTAYFGLSLLKYWRNDFSKDFIQRIVSGIVYAQTESNDIHINGGFKGLPEHPTLGNSLHAWDTQFSILFLNEYLKNKNTKRI